MTHMADTKKTIIDALNDYDFVKEPLDEHQISAAVNSFIKEKNKPDIPAEWLAEAMAFDFCADYQNAETGWGTYYGPMMVWANENGTSTESPSIKLVTPEIINYWTMRAREAKHPVLKLRYADLVWDFSRALTGDSPHFTVAQIVVDSTIEIAVKISHKYETAVITKLERALSVAIAINDTKRVETLRDTIIAYESKITIDNKPGLWGFSYDLLLENKKITLSNEISEKIIQDLEKRLERLSDISDKTNLDPWAAEKAALRLAAYYRKIDQKEEFHRVLLKLGRAFEEASKDAPALQASAWLQRVHAVYLEYGLRDEAEQIAIRLKEIGLKAKDGRRTFSSNITITNEEMDGYIHSIIEGDLETALLRTAIHFVPDKGRVENQLKDLAKEAPLSYLISKQIQDHQGRPVASIGSLEDDLIGNIVHLTAQNMGISAMFLRPVLAALINKSSLSPEKIADYLYQSPVFEDDKRTIINAGISAYLENDHLVAIHLLVPQIESAIRKLVDVAGGSVLKPARSGGFHLKTLDELLRDTRIIDIFGEDMALYLRILLTDQRGWNVRNDVCHGISPAPSFQATISDRLIHVLLCLALVRKEDNNGQNAE